MGSPVPVRGCSSLGTWPRFSAAGPLLVKVRLPNNTKRWATKRLLLKASGPIGGAGGRPLATRMPSEIRGLHRSIPRPLRDTLALGCPRLPLPPASDDALALRRAEPLPAPLWGKEQVAAGADHRRQLRCRRLQLALVAPPLPGQPRLVLLSARWLAIALARTLRHERCSAFGTDSPVWSRWGPLGARRHRPMRPRASWLLRKTSSSSHLLPRGKTRYRDMNMAASLALTVGGWLRQTQAITRRE
jgi:hypothetical protein